VSSSWSYLISLASCLRTVAQRTAECYHLLELVEISEATLVEPWQLETAWAAEQVEQAALQELSPLETASVAVERLGFLSVVVPLLPVWAAEELVTVLAETLQAGLPLDSLLVVRLLGFLSAVLLLVMLWIAVLLETASVEGQQVATLDPLPPGTVLLGRQAVT
jgi:hypothetical protein